jgi:hypothetical protein
MPQLSRTNPVAPSIIFFLSATWVCSMAVRVSYPIKFDGWARDKGCSRYELCDVMLTNSLYRILARPIRSDRNIARNKVTPHAVMFSRQTTAVGM